MTQAQFADRAGFPKQSYVGKIEGGDNKLSSLEARTAVARGFDLSIEELGDYLRGEMSVEEARRRGQQRASGRPVEAPPREIRVEREPAPPVAADAESPLEAALAQAFDASRHTLRDADAVRKILRDTYQLQASETDMLEAARVWLEAAAQLRREGQPVTYEAFVLRITVGRKPRPDQIATAEEIDRAAKEEADARARAQGREPGSKRAAVEAMLSKRKPRNPAD